VKVYILIPVHLLVRVLSFKKGVTFIEGQKSPLLHPFHFMVVLCNLVWKHIWSV